MTVWSAMHMKMKFGRNVQSVTLSDSSGLEYDFRRFSTPLSSPSLEMAKSGAEKVFSA